MPHTILVPEGLDGPRRLACRFGVLLLLGLGPPLAAPLAAVDTGDWRAGAGDGELGFELSWENEPLAGRFSRFDARIRFDPNRPEAARFEVRVELAGVDLGNPDLDQALTEPLWFDSGRFPEARFFGQAAHRLADGRYRLRGMLRLKGRRRPVDLRFQWLTVGQTPRLQGEAMLDRRDFGVGEGDWSADPAVAFPVRVWFDLNLLRQSADARY